MAIQSLGIGSNLPIRELLEQLRTAEESKLAPITAQKTENTAKISALGTVKSTLTKLQTAMAALADAKTFSALKTTVSGTGLAAASDTTAVGGTYQVKVKTLASAQNVSTVGVADKATAIDGDGVLSIAVGGGAAVNVNIAEGSTLEQMRNSINSANAGVSASIVSTGDAVNPYRLVVASKTTGATNTVSMAFAGTGTAQTLLSDGANGGSVTQIQAASDATLTINGLDVSSPTNTVKDALQGTTLTLSGLGDQTITVAKDDTAVKKSITDFVDAYNAFVNSNKTLTAFNEDSAKSGKLLGDGTLRSIQNDIRKVMNTPESGGVFSSMVEFGVALTPEGILKVDDSKLTAAVADKSDALITFFAGNGTTTGFAVRLDKTLDSILETEGKLDLATTTLNTLNKDLDKRFDSMEVSIESLLSRYEKQFSAMDMLVSQMNSTMSYLTQSFNAMNKSDS